MATIFLSRYFKTSFALAVNVYGNSVVQLVADFITWKRDGLNPRGLTDKLSAKDDNGVVFDRYARNQIRHTSLGISQNGDPVIAFRLMSNGDILLITMTSKHAMFGRKMKRKFVQQHADAFKKPPIEGEEI